MILSTIKKLGKNEIGRKKCLPTINNVLHQNSMVLHVHIEKSWLFARVDRLVGKHIKTYNFL
jgi:hypothetical protein